jgi:hypothetical protein
VCHRQAALCHHLHDVAVTEFETQIPPHAKDGDLPVKVADLEQLIQSREPGHRTAFSLSEGSNLGGLTICARAIDPATLTDAEIMNRIAALSRAGPVGRATRKVDPA